MSLDLLHILIKAACADGLITEAERSHLVKEADKVGVSIDNLNFLINTELENLKKSINSGFVTKNFKNIEQSGFITDNKLNTEQSGFIAENKNIEQSGFITSENKNLESGFVTDNKFDNYSFSLNKIFTDVSNLAEQGAMSQVQKGKYLGKWVVIKRLKHEFRDNKKYIELFYKEFENAYHLEHQNIARINGKSQDTEGIYYFMEFIDGRPLKDLINTNGIENGKLVKKIGLEILDALSYVHKKQIFHRDLKPSNILVTYKGDNVKLIDFGLALTDDFDDDLKTVGTPKYAAPEQFTQGFNADARSDIYSFGLIFLEILSGQIENQNIANERSEQAFTIIKKCSDKNPQLRYSNCEQIIDDLRSIEIADILEGENILQKKANLVHENKIDDIQTLVEFFKFTHSKWKSGDLQFFDNEFSEDPTFEEKAENNSYLDLIIKFLDKDFETVFKNYFFVKGEYLIKYDKKKFLLTNFRLFLRNSDNEAYKLIFLNKINLQNEKINTSKPPIYVGFRNLKIWQSDWELILKLFVKKDWEQLSENQLNILENKKDKARKIIDSAKVSLSYEFYNFSYDDIAFTTVYDFLKLTKTNWESIEFSKYYGNKIIDHTESIKSYIATIESVFNIYYPVKEEFLILDCFHKNGFFTNFRMFYFEELTKKYKVILLKDIEKYQIKDDIFSDSGIVEIFTKYNEKIELPLKFQSTGYAKQLKSEMSRIQQFISISSSVDLFKTKNFKHITQTKDAISLNYF